MKKILLITFLLFTTLSFAQRNESGNTVIKKSETPITITSLSASPNPFNYRTRISFQSSEYQFVEFTVKNLLGKTIFSAGIDAEIGMNTVNFERGDFPKGMYIYSIQSDAEIVSKRLVIQ